MGGAPMVLLTLDPTKQVHFWPFGALVQKRRSSTLYSIILFLERKKGYSSYSSRNKVFFMAIYNQTTLEKTRVPIDLKGEKS
jgi:hypothetical protein